MKKIFAFAIAACTVLALASCQTNEQPETPEAPVPAGYHMATLTVGNPATKATVNTATGAASWEADDFVYVATAGEVIRFTASDDTTDDPKEFHAPVSDLSTYTAAVYNRYGTVSAYDGTSLTASIPAAQNGLTGNFIAVAKSDDILAGNAVTLNQVTCGFLMTIPSEKADGLSSITVSVLDNSSDPIAIAGNVSINPATKAVSGADVKAVTVSKSFSAGEQVFIATAPFSGAKLRLAFTGIKNDVPFNYVKTVSFTDEISGEAGVINNLGALSSSWSGYTNTIIYVDTTETPEQTASGKDNDASADDGTTTTIAVDVAETVSCVLNGSTQEEAVINVNSISEGSVLIVNSDSDYDDKGSSTPTTVEINLPENTPAGAFEGLVINAPNAHVTVTVNGVSVNPETYFKSITATTADSTLEVTEGVTIDFLTVEKGSVLVKYGATVNNITMLAGAGQLRVEYYSNIDGLKTNNVDTYAGVVVNNWIDLYEGGVCRIGETLYASLADAVDAVPADGTETLIEMLSDDAVVAGINIAAGKNIVLELNGKTVSGNTDAAATYALITNKGTLVIQDNTDTKADGTGKGLLTTYITNADQQDVPGYASNTITNYGTLTVKSGKIVNNGDGYACYAIDNQTNGTLYTPVLKIEGGRMQQMNAYTYAVRMFCNSTTKVNSCAVSGGVIEGGYGLWLQTPNNKANKANLVITEGTLNARDGAALYVGGTKAVNSEISIDITGGTVNGTGIIIQGPLSGSYGSISVSGGQFANVQCGANVENFISGGIFKEQPAAGYLAEGCTYVANTDSATSAEYPYAVQSSVCKIADTYYSTLEEAVAAVPTDGSETTIEMLSDYQVLGNTGIQIAAAKNVVLDLNGHILSNLVNQDKASQVFDNYGTLTIQDSSSEGDGVLQNAAEEGTNPGEWRSTPQYNYATNVIKNSGTLVVKSGTIAQTAAGSICYAIDNNSTSSDAIAILEGGKITSERTAMRLFCNSTVKLNKLQTPAESTVEVIAAGSTAFWVHLPGSNASSMKRAELDIAGGTFKGTKYAFYDYSFGDGWDNVSYSVTGGKFVGNIISYKPVEEAGKNYGFIKGGKFSVDPANMADVDENPVVYYNHVADGHESLENTDADADVYPYKVLQVFYGTGQGATGGIPNPPVIPGL